MKRINVFKLIFLVLFAAAIVVPIVTIDLAGGKYSPIEQRNLADFPVTRNDETGKFETGRTEIQNWLSDNIGYREKLLKLCVNFKYKVLGQSTSEKVLIGKNGWFFYTMDNNTKIATGEYPLTEDDLNTIAQNQQAISDYYKSNGKTYILMLTPSKVSIYPEYLPGSDKTVDKTPVDIVTEYLREHTDVIVYNAKDALLEAKNSGAGQLYHKTDTHWNEKGAYYTYKGLHQTMVDNGILNDEAVEPTFSDGEYKGEFSSMLGDNSILPPEKAPVNNWNMKSVEIHEGELYNRVQEKENQYGTHQGANLFTNPYKSLTAQIYGDSQIEVVRKIPQLLSEHFSTFVKYSVRNVSLTVDDAVNPDVVIFSCSERFITPLLLQQGNIPILVDNDDIQTNTISCNETSYKGMWLDNVNSADLNSSEYTAGQIPKRLYEDNQTVFLNGWAADFNANMPLSALYLKVGDKTVKCQYGIERTSVSDFFQNENLKMTGFNVTIPKSYLDGVDKIEFIQVGNDGTYRFESVEYKVVDTGSFDNNLVLGNIDIPDNVKPLQDIQYYGMWLDNVNGVDFNVGHTQGEITKALYQDSNVVEFIGWAADFTVNKPLSALYLKIGERILKCEYGVERTSVSDHFQNPDLMMTGFEISFPTEYLKEINEIEFIQVGNDGTYTFEPIKYKLITQPE